MAVIKNELQNEIDNLLWLHFPDEAHQNAADWQQEPYRSDWFKLCMRAYGIIHKDAFGEFIGSQWNIRREHRLSESHERQLERLIDAWGEWQFARQKLSAGE